jgi:hypothetical protein
MKKIILEFAQKSLDKPFLFCYLQMDGLVRPYKDFNKG